MKIHLRGLALASVALLAGPCFADGTVYLDLGSAQNDIAQGLRVGANDNLYVIGRLDNVTPRQAGVLGLSPSGALLPGFADQGRLRLVNFGIADFVLSTNNSLVFTGSDDAARLQFRDPNGALTNNVALTTSTGDASHLLALADGKILLGGVPICGRCFDLSWIVSRFNADGSSDTTFANGRLEQKFSFGPQTDQGRINSLFQLPNGMVMSAGWSLTSGSDDDVDSVLSRYTATDADYSFGLNSMVTNSFESRLAVADSNNRVYLVGPHGTAIRLNGDGTTDNTFPLAGSSNLNLEITSAAVDQNNRLVIFGYTFNGGPAYIARFDSTGVRDMTFNGTGVVNFSFPRGSSGNCFGALQSGNRPVVACSVNASAGFGDIGIARFTEVGALDTTFGATQPDSDLVPDDFSFAPISAPYGTINLISAPVTITGFDAGVGLPVGASSTVGSVAVSVGCNAWVGGLQYINSGQTLCVRTNASTSPGGTAVVTVRIGTTQSQFVVNSTNTAADTTPDSFTFTTQSNVPVSGVVNSNMITISGITGYATATAVGGYLSVNCTPQSESFTFNGIENGTQLCVRIQAAATAGTEKSMTLNVGGVTATFTTTTAAAPSPPPPPPPSGGGGSGGYGGGGSVDLLMLGFLLSWLGLAQRRFVKTAR